MELHEIATHQVLSSADAAVHGFDSAALRRAATGPRVRRLVRGWFAAIAPGEPIPWHDPDPYAAARHLHLLTTRALVRSFEGRAVASHQSALVVHGVDTWQADLETVHLSRTADDHTRRRAGAALHPRAGADPVAGPSGIATVPVAFAVVQVGLLVVEATGRQQAFESLVAADAALRVGLVTCEELDATVERHTRHPGIARVRRLLEHADGRHESVGETRLAHVLRALGFAATPQVPLVADGRVRRADFVLDAAPVVVEFDGLAKYEGRGAALAEEKAREDALRAAGFEVVRFVWADLGDHARIRSRLDAAVQRSRFRGGRPAYAARS